MGERINRLHVLIALGIVAAVWLALALKGKADLFDGGVMTIAVGTAAVLRVVKDTVTTKCQHCGARIESPLPPRPGEDKR